MAAKASSKPPGNDPVSALEFLERTEPVDLPPVVACYGPDDFLRLRSLQHALSLGKIDPSTVRTFDGDDASWRDVNDELATRGLFDLDGKRAVRLRNADAFVSQHREALERWVDRPPAGSTLLVDLRTLAANTILHRRIKQQGWLITAEEPKDAPLAKWIVRWAKSHHGLSLSPPQANVLVDRIGPICGLVDCELAKLALFADDSGAVTDARVDELVGGWRTKTVWVLAEAIADGHIDAAWNAMDRLFASGQSVFGIAAQLSWSLRRYGMAVQYLEQSERNRIRVGLPQALGKAGFRAFELQTAEKRLRRIGRARGRELLSWLLELESQLKGSHSREDRGRQALELFLSKFSDSLTPPARNVS